MFTNIYFMNEYIDIIKNLDIKSSIEIGAYDADFSVSMSSLIEKNNVWAIEANPNVFNKFKENLININYINLAISNKNETIEINEIVDIKDEKEKYWFSAASSILSRMDNAITQKISIESQTLDFFIKTNKVPGPIAIWIDCEGASKQVLLSAIGSFDLIDAIYIEVEIKKIWKNQWTINNVIQFLEAKNFKLVKKFQEGYLQADLIFVRNK